MAENEIMAHWKYGCIEKPIISCCCITFNQKDYIEEALNSMLIQETEYAFEIVIHDDLSTDGTREILEKYQEKFPNIIRPIYQNVNQWSLGNRIMPIVFKYAKGEYYALCEGDDYWTDKYKLQIQIDEMKKFSNCNISFHYGMIKYENNGNNETFCKHFNENKFFSTEEVISYAGPLMPTASICITKKFVKEVLNSTDNFFKKDITAFYIQVLASVDGNARYIDRSMCVYRRMGKGSWTESIYKNYRTHVKWIFKSINSIDKIKYLTNHKYDKNFTVLQNKYYMNLMYSPIVPIKKRNLFYRKYKKKLTFLNYILVTFVYRNNLIYQIGKKIKSLIRKSI